MKRSAPGPSNVRNPARSSHASASGGSSPGSRIAVSSVSENARPSTDATRSSRRRSAGRRSICAVTTASTESGSASTSPPCAAALQQLPEEERVATRAVGQHADRVRLHRRVLGRAQQCLAALLTRQRRGPEGSHVVELGGGVGAFGVAARHAEQCRSSAQTVDHEVEHARATPRPSSGRLRARGARGWGGCDRGRARSSPARAWPGTRARGSRSRSSRGCRGRAECRAAGATARARDSRRRRLVGASPRSSRATRPGPARGGRGAATRTARTGWSPRTASHVTVMPARSEPSSRSSSVRRDLPIPGSPTSSITRPSPLRTASRSDLNAAISASRPTRGSVVDATSSRRRVAPIANAGTGSRTPFTSKGPTRLGLEPRAGAIDHGRAREDLARLGLGHEARGEVHRVAHDRVRAAVRRADVAREDRASVHADAERELRRAGRRSGATRRAFAPRRRRSPGARPRRG